MIGVDLVRVERIVSLAKKDINHKVFTENERSYASAKVGADYLGNDFCPIHRTLAGMFAAKEAFLKAIGTGISGELALSDIEILHNELGKPYVKRNEKIQNLLSNKAIITIDVSISHENEYAIAVVELLQNK